jgi:hypothetical protein
MKIDKKMKSRMRTTKGAQLRVCPQAILRSTDLVVKCKLKFLIVETRNERNDMMNPYWIDDRDLKGGVVDFLNGTEITFWKDLIEKYLAPINADEKKEVKSSWKFHVSCRKCRYVCYNVCYSLFLCSMSSSTFLFLFRDATGYYYSRPP